MAQHTNATGVLQAAGGTFLPLELPAPPGLEGPLFSAAKEVDLNQDEGHALDHTQNSSYFYILKWI